MKCEFQLPSREKKGEPVACGKPATGYHMIGQIASVITTLCEAHAERIESQGYTLKTVDPVEAERIAS